MNILNVTRLCISAVFYLGFSVCSAQVYIKTNGIIEFDANQFGVPMISNLYISGTRVMPYDNTGAGFQMTTRSPQGNSHNPTQAGDCAQNPSQLLSVDSWWTGSSLGVSGSNGLLLTVTPRLYNQPPPTFTCINPGPIVPQEFKFGATLGDGIALPEEIMVVDMYFKRLSGAETILENISEAPVIFPFLNIFPLAFWSTDGVNVQPLNLNGTNDMRMWPGEVNNDQVGKLVMACTPILSNCIALYSHKTTNVIMSRRSGLQHQLSMLTLTIDAQQDEIDDFDEHHVRTLLLVGTPSTVTSGISQAEEVISNWGDL